MHANAMTAVEEWTHDDPPVAPNANLLAELRIMSAEIARLGRIESAARTVVAHYNAGNIDSHKPLACMAIAEMGNSLGMKIARGVA